jgi:hypothetical protein
LRLELKETYNSLDQSVRNAFERLVWLRAGQPDIPQFGQKEVERDITSPLVRDALTVAWVATARLDIRNLTFYKAANQSLPDYYTTRSGWGRY